MHDLSSDTEFFTGVVLLGSMISFAIFLVYPAVISKRILNEEEVLERELAGYAEYKKKVKYQSTISNA